MTYANIDIETYLDGCKEKFNQILSDVLKETNQDAHEMETSIFKQLMKLGFLLMQLYFANKNKGSAKNNLLEFAPKFAVALIDLIEQNRRNSELFRGLLRLRIN